MIYVKLRAAVRSSANSAVLAGQERADLRSDLFLAEMHILHQRGVRKFKFVDRTFNLNIKAACDPRILPGALDDQRSCISK